MAHLQPRSSSEDGGPPERIRLTAIRGFMPDAEQLSGAQVKESWQERFREKGPGHRYWLYTHIPFCPQLCSFCQCSTALRKSDAQVASYLRWLEGEIDFLAEASDGGVAQFQYVGGGTPNILTEPQLEWLLGKLNRHFRFAPNSRRTFEFLPSALRPGTLPLLRSLGFNRLTCGIQSWSPSTLKSVNRSQLGLDELGGTIQDAYDLGYDEFNVDLIYGIANETRERFLDGLLQVLALRPTTVTIHHLIPTPGNPVFSSVEEEVAAYAVFERLEQKLGEVVARHFPHFDWVLRPNCWVLVNRRFRQQPEFSYWYYSDNERIHIDMLSFGRFAHSNLLGKLWYENLSDADRYDPQERSYRAFRKTLAVDAALDLITDLVGDRESDLTLIEERYGAAALTPLLPPLVRLQDEGIVVQRNGRWQTVHTDGVYINNFWLLLEAAMQVSSVHWPMPTSKHLERGIRIGEGERSLLVFIEKIRPEQTYFSEIGNLGIYYRNVEQQRQLDDEDWATDLMVDFLEELQRVVDEAPDISARQATARLKRHRSADHVPRRVSA